MDKPEIDYPCEWSYTPITNDPKDLMEHIEKLFPNTQYLLVESKKSSKGRFTSYSFSINVKDEAERNDYYKRLQSIPSVKYLL